MENFQAVFMVLWLGFSNLSTVVSVGCGGFRTKCPGSISHENKDGPLPVRHWPLDKDHHSSLSGGNPSARTSNTYFASTGPIEGTGSLKFTGESNSFLEIDGSGGLLSEGETFTWIMCVKPDDVNTPAERVIMEFQGNNFRNGLIVLQRETSLVVILYNTDGLYLGSHIHDGVFEENQWRFIGLVYTSPWEAFGTVFLDPYDTPEPKDRTEHYRDYPFSTPQELNTNGNLRFGAPFKGSRRGFKGEMSCIMFHTMALIGEAFQGRVEDCNPQMWINPQSVVGVTMDYPEATTETTSTTTLLSTTTFTTTFSTRTDSTTSLTEKDSTTTVSPTDGGSSIPPTETDSTTTIPPIDGGSTTTIPSTDGRSTTIPQTNFSTTILLTVRDSGTTVSPTELGSATSISSTETTSPTTKVDVTTSSGKRTDSKTTVSPTETTIPLTETYSTTIPPTENQTDSTFPPTQTDSRTPNMLTIVPEDNQDLKDNAYVTPICIPDMMDYTYVSKEPAGKINEKNIYKRCRRFKLSVNNASVSQRSLLLGTTAASRIDCSATCIEEELCVSFSFNPHSPLNTRCRLSADFQPMVDNCIRSNVFILE